MEPQDRPLVSACLPHAPVKGLRLHTAVMEGVQQPFQLGDGLLLQLSVSRQSIQPAGRNAVSWTLDANRHQTYRDRGLQNLR